MNLPAGVRRRVAARANRRPFALAQSRLPQKPARGGSVGLFGGSFNPAHGGHGHVAKTALQRCGLDRVWWLTAPSNPLKPASILAPFAARHESAQIQAAISARFDVSAFEEAAGLRFTADTLRAVRMLRPGRHFVWIMGADGLASLHRWYFWRQIIAHMPICVVARPGFEKAPLNAPAARLLRGRRLPESAAAALPCATPPAWVFLHAPLDFRSSTRLRKAANQPFSQEQAP
jgi:nicotinate-nucleotide adenylyltransferase